MFVKKKNRAQMTDKNGRILGYFVNKGWIKKKF